MEKQSFDKFVNACKEAGITDYVIRCEGGNRIVYNNTTDSRVFPKDDHVEAIYRTHNYGKSEGIFDVICIPYENIDTVKVVSITFEQGIKLMELLENKNSEEFKDLLSKIHIRKDIIPGTANLDGIKDKEGKYALPPGSSGMVVK